MSPLLRRQGVRDVTLLCLVALVFSQFAGLEAAFAAGRIRTRLQPIYTPPPVASRVDKTKPGVLGDEAEPLEVGRLYTRIADLRESSVDVDTFAFPAHLGDSVTVSLATGADATVDEVRTTFEVLNAKGKRIAPTYDGGPEAAYRAGTVYVTQLPSDGTNYVRVTTQRATGVSPRMVDYHIVVDVSPRAGFTASPLVAWSANRTTASLIAELEQAVVEIRTGWTARSRRRRGGCAPTRSSRRGSRSFGMRRRRGTRTRELLQKCLPRSALPGAWL